mgnify:FL=1
MKTTAEPASGTDPREEAEWFRRLPEHAKEEYRERWRLEGGREELRHARRRSTEVRYLVEAVLFLAVLEFLFFSLSAKRLMLLAVPGIAMGWVCHRIKANRWTYTMVALVPYLVLYGIPSLDAPWFLVIYLGCAGALGFTHEMQRADGSEGA